MQIKKVKNFDLRHWLIGQRANRAVRQADRAVARYKRHLQLRGKN